MRQTLSIKLDHSQGVTPVLAVGGLYAQNVLSDIKVQRAALEAEKKINDADKRIGDAEKREQDAEAKARDAETAREQAVHQTTALRWEAITLDREKIALEEQTRRARSGLRSILDSVQDLKQAGVAPELIGGLESQVKETSGALANCTPEEAAIYDRAMPIAVEQTGTAQRYLLPWVLSKPQAPSESLLPLYQAWWVTGYDRQRKVPLWVGYRLNGDDIKQLRRQNCWRPDPRVAPEETANDADFRGFDYDRGHLVPRSDMNRSPLAAASVFVYSNIAPQRPRLNRGPWSRLERLVRDWALRYGHVYVITGAAFDRDGDGRPDPRDWDETIGPGQVGVPSHYFKILARSEGGKPTHMLGVLLANTDARENAGPRGEVPVSAIVSVDVLETLSGFDFFPELGDEAKALESARAPDFWPS